MADYSKQHVADITIEDESSSPGQLGISIYTDSLGCVSIYLGDYMTIRTDEQGAMALEHLLSDAVGRMHREKRSEASLRENSQNSQGTDSVDIWDSNLANDPAKW